MRVLRTVFFPLFRWVAIRAFDVNLWWCVLPYIGFLSLKAEDGIAEVLNWTVKSCIVMVVIYVAFPSFRKALATGKQSAMRSRQRRRSTLGGRVPPSPSA